MFSQRLALQDVRRRVDWQRVYLPDSDLTWEDAVKILQARYEILLESRGNIGTAQQTGTPNP
jgi:hypothetical protein